MEMTERAGGPLRGMVSGVTRGERWGGGDVRDFDRDGGLVKGGVDVVDWDWVVWVGSIAGHIHHDRQVSVRVRQTLGVDEIGDLVHEVDAVDEDIRLDDLYERTAPSSLGHIPLEDILAIQPRLEAEIHRALPAAPKSANDQHAGLAAEFLGPPGDSRLDVLNQRILVREGLDGAEFAAGVDGLVGPDFEAEGGAGEARVVAKGGDSAAAFVLQEFEVEEGSAAAGEAAEDALPAGLVLEDVQEGDVGVLEGEVFVGKLLEAEDDVVGGGVDPGAFGD